jgi:membrane protein YdbS with pleckstrin-like domain
MEYETEKVLWSGGPSQWVNSNKFTVCVLIFLIAIVMPSFWNNAFQPVYPQHKDKVMLLSKLMFFGSVIYAAYAYLRVQTHRYTITTERLNEEFGILSKTTDVLELFRVKDITFAQPFNLRMFGCGNIILDTSDKSTPIVTLYAVEDGERLINILRKQVDHMRAKKGVREID